MKTFRNFIFTAIFAIAALTVSAPTASAGPLTPPPCPPGPTFAPMSNLLSLTTETNALCVYLPDGMGGFFLYCFPPSCPQQSFLPPLTDMDEKVHLF